MNAVTKSGANIPFGSTYGFFRNDKFNAADFVAKKVLPYSNQQVGGDLRRPDRPGPRPLFGYYELEREPTYLHFAGPYTAFNIPDLLGRPDRAQSRVPRGRPAE